ncbi:MAG TPA: T9SS type A sorting domain-containing protein [Ignavibacteriaceae bacterium]|nr:T9SS type A sorting domain-containing protein [Ignavibacteriaceae bacterium]
MKKLISLLIVFTFIEVLPQTTRPANVEVAITVFDNSGSSDSIQTLICGVDSMATDSIDALLDEYWILCPWSYGDGDCPPVDNFAAVFDLPASPGNGLLFGSYKDFRYGTVPYSGTITYKIYYWTRAAATALFMSWDFPEGVTGVLQDAVGGTILNYTMPDSATFTHPYFMLINFAYLILTYQNVVPVELVSFNAVLIDDNIQLEWLTTTETNNSGFEIERKALSFGEGLGEAWEAFGFVPGFGTTTETKTYSFIDENITNGTYKYRLKQIDFDGSFEYSNEIEVEVDFTPKEFVLYQNYPNPFNPKSVIGYQLPVNGNVTLKVYDILGNEVITLVDEYRAAGKYEIEFNLASGIRNPASGVYFYKLIAGEFTQTRKMILLR